METSGSPISPGERQSQIAELLLRNASVSIQTLAQMFQVSSMTIRRDLDELERQGKLWKVRGGATAQPTYLFESHLTYRLNACREEKQAIAAAALRYIEPSEVVMLDDSTTAFALAEKLVDISHLTVITNFLSIIDTLHHHNQISLICLGGDYLFRHNAFIGDLCEQTIRSLRANILFMSSSALTGGYVFHQEENIVRVKRAMIQSSARRILLMDHTKLGKQALRELAPLSKFDLVIVDSKTSPKEIEAIKELGVPVEIAPESEG